MKKAICKGIEFYADKYGNVYKMVKDVLRKLSPTKTDKGYLAVTVWDNKKTVTLRSHRIIAIAFIPNPKNLPQVNHKDGIKTNNTPSNLEWVTNRENINHAITTGLSDANKGETHYHAKLTNRDVVKIKELIGIKTNEHISIMFGVSNTVVSRIKTGKAWKHIKCHKASDKGAK